jgi:predicted nucleotide-binding protein
MVTTDLQHQSEDLAAALGLAVSTGYRGGGEAIRRVVGILGTATMSVLLQRALPTVDFEAWLSSVAKAGGRTVGSGRLSWPVETGDRVALQLELLRAISEGQKVKLQAFLMRFFGSQMDLAYSQFASDIIVPFSGDLERLLNRALAATPGAETPMQNSKEADDVVDKTVVFVVHGRNGKARAALFDFLRAIHLHPLEWSEALALVPGATPYIGDVLDAAFAKARAVVVLLSGDDEAQLREAHRGPHEEPHETNLTPQARANVLFEAGLAFGTHPDRTVLIELGRLRPFSDVGGRHTVRISNAVHARQDLAQRLRKAGCAVNLDGTDWHSAGDFDAALAVDQAARAQNTQVPEPQAPDEFPIELFLGTTNLASGTAEYQENVPYIRPPITVQNRTGKRLAEGTFRVGLVCGPEFPNCNGAVTTLLPDGRLMHALPGPRGLFPGESFTFDFDLAPDERMERATVVTVRVLTEAGPRDFPVTVIQKAYTRP